MARTQVWADPNPPGGSYGKLRNRVFISASAAPTISPAPSGHPIVPEGWVLQIGGDGGIDLMQRDERPSGTPADLHFVTGIDSIVVPYYSGGWPPDPLIGTPGHTPPVPFAG